MYFPWAGTVSKIWLAEHSGTFAQLSEGFWQESKTNETVTEFCSQVHSEKKKKTKHIIYIVYYYILYIYFLLFYFFSLFSIIYTAITTLDVLH